jgi:hypothetical protein
MAHKGYLVLAGPQAAGKTTFLAAAQKRSSLIIPLQESRQIIVHRRKRRGAIFMTKEDEIEVIHHDMQRMFSILEAPISGALYVDETNVFTLGHAKAHGINLITGYFKQYCDLLSALEATILFIDVSPHVSWLRRRFKYLARLQDLRPIEIKCTLDLFRRYLNRLHGELDTVYSSLPLPKVRVDGSESIAATRRRGLGIIEDILTDPSRGNDVSWDSITSTQIITPKLRTPLQGEGYIYSPRRD